MRQQKALNEAQGQLRIKLVNCLAKFSSMLPNMSQSCKFPKSSYRGHWFMQLQSRSLSHAASATQLQPRSFHHAVSVKQLQLRSISHAATASATQLQPRCFSHAASATQLQPRSFSHAVTATQLPPRSFSQAATAMQHQPSSYSISHTASATQIQPRSFSHAAPPNCIWSFRAVSSQVIIRIRLKNKNDWEGMSIASLRYKAVTICVRVHDMQQSIGTILLSNYKD